MALQCQKGSPSFLGNGIAARGYPQHRGIAAQTEAAVLCAREGEHAIVRPKDRRSPKLW
jgi:hypothetical protein